MSSARFPRTHRLSGRAAFGRLFREGISLRSGWLSLQVFPNQLSRVRFGCTVRREAAPAGVFRSRLKRWLREAFRRNQEIFPAGVDMVAVIWNKPADLSYQEVERTFLDLSRRLAQALGG